LILCRLVAVVVVWFAQISHRYFGSIRKPKDLVASVPSHTSRNPPLHSAIHQRPRLCKVSVCLAKHDTAEFWVFPRVLCCSHQQCVALASTSSSTIQTLEHTFLVSVVLVQTEEQSLLWERPVRNIRVARYERTQSLKLSQETTSTSLFSFCNVDHSSDHGSRPQQASQIMARYIYRTVALQSADIQDGFALRTLRFIFRHRSLLLSAAR